MPDGSPQPAAWPRLLSRARLAAYLGIGYDAVGDYRRRGIIPPPIEGTTRWDRRQVDWWLDRRAGLPAESGAERHDPGVEALGERARALRHPPQTR